MTPLAALRDTIGPGVRGGLFYLGYWGVTGVYIPFIYVYFVQLGLSGREIGILAALLPCMTFVVAPSLAALADRYRWRVRLLVLSLTGLTLALLLLSLAHTFLALLPLMLLFALFRSPVLPIGDSLIARMSTRHSLNYGKMRLWGSLGFAIIAIACGALWQRLGFELMFPLAGSLFIPVVLIGAMLEEGPVVEQQTRRPLRELGRDPALVALLVATFLVGAALGMNITFEGVLMDHLGGGAFLIGLQLGLSALCELPTMRYGTALMQRMHGPRTLLLSYGLMGSAFFGFGLATSPWTMLALALLKGLGFGLFFVSTIKLLHERAPDEWSATVQGIMNAAAFGLAPLIAGPLSGAIYDAFGPNAVFLACVLAVGLAASVIGVTSTRRLFEELPGLPPA